MHIDALPRHLVAVLVLIQQDDSILLVQQNIGPGLWGLPGGLMEVGESVDQAAAREVLEETGLIVRATRAIGFYSVPSERALSLTFEGEVIGGEILQTTSETRACACFPNDQLPELMRPYHRERVSDFIAQLAQPIFRLQ